MKTLWGIRHIRWWFHSVMFAMWWHRCGRHYWLAPNQADIDFLNAIRRGDA